MEIMRAGRVLLGVTAGAAAGAAGGPKAVQLGATLMHGRAGWQAVAADQAQHGSRGVRALNAVLYGVLGGVAALGK
jgi:hypothetical protein